MEEKQPWATCLFTDILLSHLEECRGRTLTIDYTKLFQGVEGFETPSKPELFLRDVTNWVPLSVLREVMSQCETLSGTDNFAYHAARSYFTPGKRQLPSLFEIIVHVLNDVRSVLACANFWGAVQTNYLKLQSFEQPAGTSGLYLLAQFDEAAKPSFRTIGLLRGICEGFPRLYPFIEDVQCIEEILQLCIRDIVGDFPGFVTANRGNRLLVCKRNSDEVCAEAVRISLARESVSLSPELLALAPDNPVVRPKDGQIEVLTKDEKSDAEPALRTSAYRIVIPGAISSGSVSFSFKEGQIYDAPYSRFRFRVKEKPSPQREMKGDDLRKEISHLLFEHLRQIKQAHMRMIQFNVDKRQLTLENIRLRREIEREYSFAGILGRSKSMQDLFGLIRSIAETDVSVLIQGETGTGKELIAKAIHYNSTRKEKRFVAVNCGALSLTLLESELFGHEKGSFTGASAQKKGFFEVADGGTLFLDEIGEMTPATQVKLLRVLQEGELQRVGGTDVLKVDVRIIAATNKSLEDQVEEGEFRQDLYYRLKVLPVIVAPLRERKDDIPLLAAHFIEKYSQSTKKPAREINPPAMALMMAYSWPGNVRELENAIQHMMVVSKGDLLDVLDLPAEIRGTENESKAELKDLKGISRESTELVEKRAILDALSQTAGNVTRAAKVLGVSRATLQNKMKSYRLRQVKEE